MTITVEIERLLLDGFRLTRREQAQLQASLENELGRLLASDGLAAHRLEQGDVPHLSTSGLAYQPGQDAAGLGQHIAQTVYEGIGRR